MRREGHPWFFWHRSVRKDAFDTISSFQTHFQQVLVQPTSSVARASGSMKARWCVRFMNTACFYIGHLHLKVVVSGIALWWRNALGPRSLPGVSCAFTMRWFVNRFRAFERLVWLIFWLWPKHECKKTHRHIETHLQHLQNQINASSSFWEKKSSAQAVLIGTNAMKSSDVGQAKSKCRKSFLVIFILCIIVL